MVKQGQNEVTRARPRLYGILVHGNEMRARLRLPPLEEHRAAVDRERGSRHARSRSLNSDFRLSQTRVRVAAAFF
jgi:hypothetical protein